MTSPLKQNLYLFVGVLAFKKVKVKQGFQFITLGIFAMKLQPCNM